MWDKWKKKIENFIWEDEDDIQKEQQERAHQKQQVKARMVYQYPEQSLRFPVTEKKIKQEEPKQSTEVPAFQRRRTREAQHWNHESNSSYEQKESITESKREKPFQPTEVPSPIYGYRQRRQEPKLEEEPAFIRKQKEMKAQQLENQQEIQKENNIAREEIASTTMEKVSRSIVDQPQRSVNEKEQKKTTNQEQTKKHSDRQNVTKSNQENFHNEKEVKVNKSTSIPFNVMMTPRDKKHLFEKKKREQVHSQKEVSREKVASQRMGSEENTEVKSLPIHLLNDPVKSNQTNHIWIKEQQSLLEETLKHFNVRAKVVRATQGPSVTRFEVHPELGVKVSKVKNLSDDLKLNMAAKDIRIEAPIPGKNTIGIEVPNPMAKMVGLQEIFETNDFKDSTSPLTIALGLNIEGTPVVTNIQKMPHGLIAGATGSGKSVCINTILISLIYKANHEDVKFMLIDPKMVELAPYNGIPHLVSPVITDVKAATAALKWAVNEMEDRYNRFVQEGVRDVERYNQKVKREGRAHEKMSFIVIVIDELADLMMVSPQDVEDAISRIAQKARACGIHLLLATQRPSVDVLTGLIKANIPTRIAFSVSSQVDSRTILDSSGAEKLLGKGDMLFIENGSGKSVRLQGPFVSDEEVERITAHVRNLAEPNYLFEQETLLEQITSDEEEDELLPDAIDFVLNQNSASTSLLQRHFKIGYNRAARMIDTLEGKGIISGQNGSKPREVLISRSQMEEI